MEISTSKLGLLLLDWHQEIDRDMPWTKTKDPYAIWVSEVILQQTRVDQGRLYYDRMLDLFPTVHDLAKATEDEVMAAWKGLGYYTRARNLHASANMIVDHFDGKFPSKYEDILSLKGIGPYSAAAIGSFAFGLPYAVVDGNVYRVLSRVFGIDTPTDSTEGISLFARLAQDNLPKDHPGDYNQAIMDFGATVCKPIAPKCDDCPLQHICQALKEDRILDLPVKSKKVKVRKRYFRFLVAVRAGMVLLRKREERDVWRGLYEPLMIESGPVYSKKLFVEDLQKQFDLSLATTDLRPVVALKQQLTHQLIHASFYQLKNDLDGAIALEGTWIELDQLDTLGLPKVVDTFLKGMQSVGMQGELF